jgi:hypothetical protein
LLEALFNILQLKKLRFTVCLSRLAKVACNYVLRWFQVAQAARLASDNNLMKTILKIKKQYKDGVQKLQSHFRNQDNEVWFDFLIMPMNNVRKRKEITACCDGILKRKKLDIILYYFVHNVVMYISIFCNLYML